MNISTIIRGQSMEEFLQWVALDSNCNYDSLSVTNKMSLCKKCQDIPFESQITKILYKDLTREIFEEFRLDTQRYLFEGFVVNHDTSGESEDVSVAVEVKKEQEVLHTLKEQELALMEAMAEIAASVEESPSVSFDVTQEIPVVVAEETLDSDTLTFVEAVEGAEVPSESTSELEADAVAQEVASIEEEPVVEPVYSTEEVEEKEGGSVMSNLVKVGSGVVADEVTGLVVTVEEAVSVSAVASEDTVSVEAVENIVVDGVVVEDVVVDVVTAEVEATITEASSQEVSGEVVCETVVKVESQDGVEEEMVMGNVGAGVNGGVVVIDCFVGGVHFENTSLDRVVVAGVSFDRAVAVVCGEINGAVVVNGTVLFDGSVENSFVVNGVAVRNVTEVTVVDTCVANYTVAEGGKEIMVKVAGVVGVVGEEVLADVIAANGNRVDGVEVSVTMDAIKAAMGEVAADDEMAAIIEDAISGAASEDVVVENDVDSMTAEEAEEKVSRIHLEIKRLAGCISSLDAKMQEISQMTYTEAYVEVRKQVLVWLEKFGNIQVLQNAKAQVLKAFGYIKGLFAGLVKKAVEKCPKLEGFFDKLGKALKFVGGAIRVAAKFVADRLLFVGVAVVKASYGLLSTVVDKTMDKVAEVAEDHGIYSRQDAVDKAKAMASAQFKKAKTFATEKFLDVKEGLAEKAASAKEKFAEVKATADMVKVGVSYATDIIKAEIEHESAMDDALEELTNVVFEQVDVTTSECEEEDGEDE